MNDEIFNRLISPHRWLSQNFIFIGEYDTITLLLVYYNFLFARPINHVINSGLKTPSRIFRTSVSRYYYCIVRKRSYKHVIDCRHTICEYRVQERPQTCPCDTPACILRIDDRLSCATTRKYRSFE